jgi:hypothetical protein
LLPFAASMLVKADEPGHYSLNTPFNAKYGKEVFFGAVQINKRYVSFHWMPVYMFPQLLDEVSVPLKKRMQGKSCFNFKDIDEPLFAELEQLTQHSIALVHSKL